MKTNKVIKFTWHVNRRTTDLYFYAGSYQDATSEIEGEINRNSYGISGYPISDRVEEELSEEMNMDFWEKKYEDEPEKFEDMMEKFHEGIWELATEKQWREAVLEEGAKESQADMFWWTVYEAMTMVDFSKRISPEREKKIIELYGNYTIKELYNIYLDYVELYYKTNYIENPEANYVQNEMIKDFWKGLLNKEIIEFSNGPTIDFSEGLPDSENWFGYN